MVVEVIEIPRFHIHQKTVNNTIAAHGKHFSREKEAVSVKTCDPVLVHRVHKWKLRQPPTHS